jgi:hypothetical protein
MSFTLSTLDFVYDTPDATRFNVAQFLKAAQPHRDIGARRRT